jgi:hypothetical protein
MADIIGQIVEAAALKQVDDLKKELNSLLDVFVKVNAEASKFKPSSPGSTNSIKDNSRALTELEKITKSAITAQNKLTASEYEAFKVLQKNKLALAEKTRATKEDIKLNQAAKGSYDQLNSELNKATRAMKAMSAEERKAAAGKDLKKHIQSLDKELKDLDATMGKHNRNVGNYSSALSGLKSQFMGLISLTAGLAFLGTQIKEGIGDARVLEGVRVAFDKLNDPNLLSNLEKATKGTVNNLDLMKAGVQAKNLGVPIEQLGVLFGFAQQRALETGESVDYLVDSIVKGIGRKSPLILDNLGISAIALKEKLGSITTAQATTGQVAEAVGKIIQESQAESGQAIDETQSKLLRAQAAWENTRAELGERLLPIYGKLTADASEFFITMLDGLKKIGSSKGGQNAVSQLESLYNATKRLGRALSEMFGPTLLKAANYVIGNIIGILNEFNRLVKVLSGTIGFFNGIFKSHTESLKKESVTWSKILKDIFTLDVDSLITDFKSKLKSIYNYFKDMGSAAISGWNSGYNDPLANSSDWLKNKLKFAKGLSQSGSVAGQGINTPGKIVKNKDKKKPKTEAELLEENWYKMLELEDEVNKRREQMADDESKRILKTFEDKRTALENASELELAQLDAQYAKGGIKTELYEKTRNEIKLKYALKNLEIEIGYAQDSLANGGLQGEERAKMEKYYQKLRTAIVKTEAEIQKGIQKDSEDETLEAIEKRKKALEESLKQLELLGKVFVEALRSDIGGIIFDKQLLRLDEEKRAIEDKYALEAELIKANFTTIEERDKALAILAIKKAAEERRIAREQLVIKQRQARFQKAIDVAEIISKTALAIIGYQANPGFPAGIPLAYAAAATGAVQLAKVLATPIPQYAEGTEGHKGGLAIVGDGGKKEVIQTPDGKTYLTPDKSTIVDLPQHTKVFKDVDSYLYQTPKNRRYKSTMTNTTIVEFSEMRTDIKELTKVMKGKNTSVNIYGNAGFLTYKIGNVI